HWQARHAIPGDFALLSGERSRTIALDHGTVLLRAESEDGLHGVAARLAHAPHPPDRQALRACEAVVVRRIDRPLRKRRADRQYHRPVHEDELPRYVPHAAHGKAPCDRALQADGGWQIP